MKIIKHPNTVGHVNILGVKVNATNMLNTLTTISGWIMNGEKKYVCVTGVHGVMESQNDDSLKVIHNNSGMTVPDGMPIVWIGKLYGHIEMGRVYGPDLMSEICRISVRNEYKHFLYGGNYGVAQELKKRIEKKYPGIRVVGSYTPPFRRLNSEEENDLKRIVRETKPDIFWVGLSTPKQERFMAEYLPQLETKIMLGVGAAFDVHTNRMKDAPKFLKTIGLQWLHRLYQDPRRLWRRYLYNNPIFVLKIIKQLITR